jgi:IS30 family transposase
MKPKPDDGLEWLREIRRQMAQQFHYDPKQAGQYYRKLARRPGVKLYQRQDRLTTTR